MQMYQRSLLSCVITAVCDCAVPGGAGAKMRKPTIAPKGAMLDRTAVAYVCGQICVIQSALPKVLRYLGHGKSLTCVTSSAEAMSACKWQSVTGPESSLFTNAASYIHGTSHLNIDHLEMQEPRTIYEDSDCEWLSKPIVPNWCQQVCTPSLYLLHS